MANIQYTIRGIPPALDQVIRKRSKQTGKSFNQTVVELLSLQTFGTLTLKSDDNFEWLYGVGKETLGKEFDEAMKAQSEVDPKLWR